MPPRKRQRLPAIESSTYTADEEFWFEDGNIVLIAEAVGFKVYEGILSAHSDVFRDMFSLPNPNDSGASPASVHLSDSALDLRRLLTRFMPGRRYQTSPDHSVSVLCSLARLAHKYQIDHLLSDALARLETDFTPSFSSWASHGRPGGIQPILTPHFAIEIVNVARLTETLSILPIALLCCTTADGAALMRGYVREDGLLETLAPADIARCIDAKVALGQAAALAISKVFRAGVAPCCTTKSCRATLEHVVGEIELRPNCLTHAMLLRPALRRILADLAVTVSAQLCAGCATALQAREREEFQRLFQKLPEIFRLDLKAWPTDACQATSADRSG